MPGRSMTCTVATWLRSMRICGASARESAERPRSTIACGPPPLPVGGGAQLERHGDPFTALLGRDAGETLPDEGLVPEGFLQGRHAEPAPIAIDCDEEAVGQEAGRVPPVRAPLFEGDRRRSVGRRDVAPAHIDEFEGL